jgi:hypothetical protein
MHSVRVSFALVGLGLLVLPLLVCAAPVYLTCTLKASETTYQVSLTVEQEQGTVTTTSENGAAFKAQGFFTPDTITFQEVMPSTTGIMTTRRFQLQRKDLSIQETLIIEAPKFKTQIAPVSISRYGTCQIVAATKNKI